MAYYIMHNTATFGCTMMQNLLFNITKITTSFFSVHNIMVSNFQRDQCLLLSFFNLTKNLFNKKIPRTCRVT